MIFHYALKIPRLSNVLDQVMEVQYFLMKAQIVFYIGYVLINAIHLVVIMDNFVGFI